MLCERVNFNEMTKAEVAIAHLLAEMDDPSVRYCLCCT